MAVKSDKSRISPKKTSKTSLKHADLPKVKAQPRVDEAGVPPRDSLGASLAKDAAHYDQMPYTSHPFPQTHPARLGALAKLFALMPPAIETARILEIGCASGGNIIPLAARLPQAHIVGVDISSVQVNSGKARITALGLSNIQLHCLSITDFEAEAGSFDYIICHGVFSWVPAAVREAILAKIAIFLSPDGIADVSYNVLPGWRMRQALRDAMVLHAGAADPGQRVARARWMLNFMKENTNTATVWGQMFQKEAESLSQLGDDYITHEFLEPNNEPMTFMAFAELANKVKLGYLGDADLTMMIPENISPATAAILRETGGGQVIAVEQYMDVVTGRTFRQSLLIHQEKLAVISRNLTIDRLAGLHISAHRGTRKQVSAEGVTVFTDLQGRTLSTRHDCVVQTLDRLGARAPATLRFEELFPVGMTNQDAALVADALIKMLQGGQILLSLAPVNCANKAGDYPQAEAFIRIDAQNSNKAVNIVHESVMLNAMTQVLLPVLDGTRDRAALIEHVAEAMLDGRMNLTRNGQLLTDQNEIRRECVAHVEAALAELAFSGLLIR